MLIIVNVFDEDNYHPDDNVVNVLYWPMDNNNQKKNALSPEQDCGTRKYNRINPMRKQAKHHESNYRTIITSQMEEKITQKLEEIFMAVRLNRLDIKA